MAGNDRTANTDQAPCSAAGFVQGAPSEAAKAMIERSREAARDEQGRRELGPTPAALIAACDRICGVKSNYHKDRCPLYKANCEAMMNLVTLNPARKPIPAVSGDDPLVRSVRAYTARLRAEAARLRDLADKYDALADNSDPVPVVVSAATSGLTKGSTQ